MPSEIDLINKKRTNSIDIPNVVISFLGNQLHTNIDDIMDYDWNGRTIKRHRAEIRNHFDLKEISLQDTDELIEWLYLNNDCYNKKIVIIVALKRLRELKLEPPTSDRMDRIASSAITNYERRFFLSIKRELSSESLFLMDQLINDFIRSEDSILKNDIITFNTLKSDPGRIGLESILAEAKKLQRWSDFSFSFRSTE